MEISRTTEAKDKGELIQLLITIKYIGSISMVYLSLLMNTYHFVLMATLHLRVQRNYGRDDVYIANDFEAKAVRQLTGKLTVNQADIEALMDLGLTCTFGADHAHTFKIAEAIR